VYSDVVRRNYVGYVFLVATPPKNITHDIFWTSLACTRNKKMLYFTRGM
jgi:hypothetical protein